MAQQVPLTATPTESHRAFVQAPLGSYTTAKSPSMGLPGIGKMATAKLREAHLYTSAAVFGQYLAFDRKPQTFLAYLEEEVGVVFKGNQHHTKEAIKAALIAALDEKWEIIKEY